MAGGQRESSRGQSGLDRLMLFVFAVVVIVLVVPFVLGLGGVDVRGGNLDSGGTPTPNAAAGPGSVIVLGATGEAGPDGSVGVVRVAITKNGTGAPVDAGKLTATWTNGGSYSLVAEESGGSGADGAFGLDVTGLSESGTVLNQTGDRATLTFDLGRDDVDGVPEFGQRLQPGSTVTLWLTPDGGTTTTVTLSVSQTPDDGDAVTLRRGS